MNRKPFTSGYFIKLLSFSLIIGVLPLLVLGYLSYNKSSAILQEEVNQGNLLVLSQHQFEVEQLLKTTDVLAANVINTPVQGTSDIRLSSSFVLNLPFNLEYYKTINSLVSNISQIKLFELGITDVNLVSLNEQWIVQRGIVFQVNKLDRKYTEDTKILDLYDRLIGYLQNQFNSFWAIDNDNQMLTLVKYIPFNSTNPNGILAVNVPVSEIGKRLPKDERLGNVFIVNADGELIADTTESQIYHDFYNEGHFQLFQKQDSSGIFPNIQINGNNYAVTYSKSSYNGWRYFTINPVETTTRKADSIKIYTFVLAMSIMGSIIALSFLGSWRMYSPIERVYKLIHSATSEENRARDEFRYIGDQVLDLVDRQHKMKDDLKGLDVKAQELFVIKLIYGEWSIKEVKENSLRHGCDKQWEQYCLIAVQIDLLDQTHYTEQDRSLLMYAVNNMVSELIPDEYRYTPVMINQTLYTIVGISNDALHKSIKEEMMVRTNKIQQEIRKYLKITVSIGISRCYSDLNMVRDAYEESKDALTYRVRLGQETTIFIDEVEAEKLPRIRYPKVLEHELIESVSEFNLERSEEVFDKILNHLLEENMGYDDFRIYLNRIVSSLTAIIQDQGGSVIEVVGKKTFGIDEMLNLKTGKEIKLWFMGDLIQPTIEWLEKSEQKRDINISDAVKQIIYEGYNQDLSIELCASRLKFHPNYISRVFHKETGKTFTEFLTEYRMQVAKRWLNETDLKVSEIAERLCYSNASNFIRQFKKIENMTPMQYRKILLGKKGDSS